MTNKKKFITLAFSIAFSFGGILNAFSEEKNITKKTPIPIKKVVKKSPLPTQSPKVTTSDNNDIEIEEIKAAIIKLNQKIDSIKTKKTEIKPSVKPVTKKVINHLPTATKTEPKKLETTAITNEKSKAIPSAKPDVNKKPVAKIIVKEEIKKIPIPKKTAIPTPVATTSPKPTPIKTPISTPVPSPSILPTAVPTKAENPSPVPTQTPEVTPTPIPTPVPTLTPVVIDEADINYFSALESTYASLDLIYLVNDSICSKGHEYCNSDELLTKVAETILNDLKNKYPTSYKQFDILKIKTLLLNSLSMKDKFKDNQKELKKLDEIKTQIQKLNENLFKLKREKIIKKVQEDEAKKALLPKTDTTPSTLENVGGKIVFVSEREGNPQIYTMNADGTNQIRITTNKFYEIMPVFSPDGSKIAFVSDRDGNPEIYVMNVDGSNSLRLTNEPSYDYSPSWSPDGKKIVFISNREVVNPSADNIVAKMTYKIYTMNVDGTEQKKINDLTSDDESPKWSPDGSKILFVSKREGNPEIYTMDPDGTNTAKITTSKYSIMPSWSPDGKKIVYRANENGNPEIYIMNADGTEKKKITNNLVAGESPSWSIDGSKIIFVSKRDNVLSADETLTNEIYMMTFDGKNVNRLTNNFFDDYSPNFGK